MNDIIQEIRNGNKAAVKAVYQKYAKDVYNFAKSITGDHDSALFATKKTFSVLFNNIKHGDEPTNLRTAALKIAYDEAYNAATALKSSDNSTEAYAESESPANKTYLTPKNIEDNSYDPRPVSSSYDYDDAYSARSSRTPAKRQPHYDEPTYDEPAYDEYNDYAQDNYDDYEEYEAPKKSKRGKSKADVYNAFDDDQYDDYDDETKSEKHRNKGLFVLCIIINVILILILLWFLCGLLVNLGVLPEIDLGYTWFNETIYPLF